MLVEIGHDGVGQGPAVTYANIPDEAYTMEAGHDSRDVALHLVRNPQVTHLPGLEAFLSIAHPLGVMAGHNVEKPNWVRSSNDDLTALLSEYFGVPGEAPDHLEDTYWTKHGSMTYMPGAQPPPDDGIQMLLTNSGRDIWAQSMYSAGTAATTVGQTGTATATTATSLTGGTEAPGGSHASNDAVGQLIVAWSNGAYGIVTANTTGTTPVYTVDRWYTPGTPGGAAATTPGATTGYSLLPGGPANIFIGISSTNTAPASTDTTLPGEITTAGGGLIRKVAVGAHTAGTNIVTSTGVFTANGTDTLPVTLYKMGIGPSLTSGVRNEMQTMLSASATLNVAGDQLTITDTVTGS
jgi:hypothetical protein